MRELDAEEDDSDVEDPFQDLDDADADGIALFHKVKFMFYSCYKMFDE